MPSDLQATLDALIRAFERIRKLKISAFESNARMLAAQRRHGMYLGEATRLLQQRNQQVTVSNRSDSPSSTLA